MSTSINTNIAAYYAQGNINTASNSAQSSVARLSSGNAIVQASDNVAALATGTSLASEVNALKAAQSNAAQGSSLLQVADGALSQIQAILQQQTSIAQQAQSGSLTDTDRGFLNQQFQALSAEIDQIAQGTDFNGVKLLNGGLGTTTILAPTATAAAKFNPTAVTGSDVGTAAASTSPIQAFLNDGTSMAGTGSAGHLDITDSAGTLLTTGYGSVNSALSGQFSGFKLSNVIYGAAGTATFTATINGVDFSGNIATGATTAVIHNGSTYMKLKFSAITLTDADTTATAQAQLALDFKNTFIERTSTVAGVDFAGTRLDGAVGSAAFGTASARLINPNATISDFKYGGNTGATDSNIISVQINGQTFLATSVLDALGTATGTMNFQSQDGQSLVVDITGITVDFTALGTDTTQQTGLINALNSGFSKAGSGLNFTVGSTADASIKVSLASATATSLFNNQSLSVGTAADAAAASVALAVASNTATALRSSVGALESQFNFASANLQTTIQNQDAARSSLLDTNIATEATSYATSQVKLQAGISVLAQANQQLQALLKLIG